MDESLDLLDGLDIDIPVGPDAEASDEHKAVFFGPYQLIQQVGSGGVAKVYRARHIHPSYADKTFAIKILHEELSRDPKVTELFRAEAYVLSLLKHPNIVQTFEAGRQDDKLFIAMEYIDGRDLDNMVLRCQKLRVPLPLPVVMHMLGEALRALSFAHDLTDGDGNHLQLVHRDVNPANVFLSYDGRVKLGDFGVASIAAGRVEKDRQLAGKMGYFAPEQLDGEEVDHRADIFAMGVMIFEMLTGQRLFEAEDADKMMRLNRRAKIPKPTKINPAIPKPLEEAILCALERKPDDRFASGREMMAALQPFIPPAHGMPLAVAALMRKVFLNEHIQELHISEGLAGHVRGSGQLVSVYSTDQRAQAAFNELLRSRGYRVEVSPSLDALTGAIAKNPPQVVLVDVNSSDFSVDRTAEVVARPDAAFSVVAVSDGLDIELIRRADTIGAVDLLFKPFNVERVLAAMRAAVTGAARVARVDLSESASNSRFRPKVLMLSKDGDIAGPLKKALEERGFEVDVCATSADALERTQRTSFHAVIYDAYPASPADRFFAAHFRGRPGMGLVPILYIAVPEAQSIFAGGDADRSAVRPRGDPPQVLVETLNRLRGDTRLGRTFIRYPAHFAVEVRYGGRAFEGSAVDISRGGIMVRCRQMPPVGTDIGVSMSLPTSSSPVQVRGRVARVDMAKEGAGIGVEFERFAGRGEMEIINFLGSIDQNAKQRRQTVIMAAPPPAK